MTLHWAAAYIGKPWRLGAVGPDEFDCWGLLRHAFHARTGHLVPAIPHDADDQLARMRDFERHPERARWRKVDAPQELDAVLMAHARYPSHVGLWVDADGGRVLHACRPSVVAQDFLSLRQSGYLVAGVYRHDTR